MIWLALALLYSMAGAGFAIGCAEVATRRKRPCTPARVISTALFWPAGLMAIAAIVLGEIAER